MTSARPKPLDLRHRFFRPLWRRIAVVVVLALWTVVEGIAGSAYWAVLTGGIGVYAAYVFFFDFVLPEADKPTSPPAPRV